MNFDCSLYSFTSFCKNAVYKYEGDAQWYDYVNEKDLWDFAAVRITNGSSCEDAVTMPANFTPYRAD